jgi:enamine deaminase RidA (YjgF/YER057c/UK114 family)
MSPEQTLAKLGLSLPALGKPVAAYVPAVRTGNLLYVSGQLPFVDGKLPKTGRLGEGVSVDEGKEMARTCVLNALAVIKAEAGDLSRVKRVVRVGAFIASANDFTQQPQVANGASELLQQVFGEAGRHARAAVGVNVLPLGAPVEVEMLVELA